MHLKGKSAIVTGAGRGIGRAVALRLAREGANVAFNYLRDEEAARSLKAEIENAGVRALSFQADARDYDSIQEMKRAVVDEFKSLDILVNNAGIVKDGALMMMTREDWQDVVDTNLNGVFNMTKAVITHFMKRKGGHIINIASVSGLRGMAGQTNYASSKGGVIAFAKSLAKEVAAYNIRVNVVAPGFIGTDMVSHLKEDYLTEVISKIPLGRLGSPEDIANTVNFLLSPEAGYITGQVVQVDGGFAL
jgi:3-oxoacyl-[acyl-carrier protein] reductase